MSQTGPPINEDLAALTEARGQATHPSGRGRFDGLITEAAVGKIVHGLGWRRVDTSNPPQRAERILAALRTFEGLEVGRNSAVEGLYEVDNLTRLLHVEATGAFAPRDVKIVGLRRSDNAHKVNSRVRLIRAAALESGDCPPIPVIFTSHLAMPGTEAGGVVLALAAIEGVVVEVDDDGTIRETYGPLDLRRLLSSDSGPIRRIRHRVTPISYGPVERFGRSGPP